MFDTRRFCYWIVAIVITTLVAVSILHDGVRRHAQGYFDKVAQKPNDEPDPIKYRPEPTWTPPPVRDPFPALATSAPPPIPSWNKPKDKLHEDYGIEYAPPLFIGFTRTWPILLQAVVSYITAGWPASQIYVVENTGVQQANVQGKLTLQNPYYFNYDQMKKLGVNVIQSPVLMNFAQLQNFYLHLAHVNNWPQYFWSHMDVLVLSHEEGKEGVTPKAGEEGYMTVYELCLAELNRTRHSNDRWADKFFAYDHLTLVNREAYDDVGGWDTFIPYYMTDCDMHSRLGMRNWSQRDADAGIVFDVSTVLEDLRALYRDPSVEPSWIDPNPGPPSANGRDAPISEQIESKDDVPHDEYWAKLRDAGHVMDAFKHDGRGRNTWHTGQRGGEGEPYYYPSLGIIEGIDVLTEAGREVYRRKWGHRNCGLDKYKFEDQWRVLQDW